MAYNPVDNSIYAAGYIRGSGLFDFGNGVTINGYSTGYHPVIVKYAPDGNAIWARTILSGPIMSSMAQYNALAVNSSGEILAAGVIQGSSPAVDFGGVSVTGVAPGLNGVLAKYDSSGNVLWVKVPQSGTMNTDFKALAIDASDNIIVTGRQNSTGAMDYGGGVIVTGGVTGDNLLVLKYNNAGTALWGRTILSGGTANAGLGIAVHPITGDIYVAGYQYNTATYDYGGGVTLTGLYTTYNLFLLRYNAAGSIQWGRTTVAGTQSTIFYDVAVDASGKVCAVGQQTSTVTYDFGGGVTSTGASTVNNAALVCYNPSGLPLWARTTVVAGGSSNPFKSVTIDSAGNLLTAGSQSGTGSYSYGAGVSATGSYSLWNPILVKYNSAGTPLWARSTIVGANSSLFQSITTDGTNHVYAVGYQTGSGDFTYGPGVTATGDHTARNAVIVKYSP